MIKITFLLVTMFLTPNAYSANTSLFQIVFGNCNVTVSSQGEVKNVSGGCNNIDPVLIEKLRNIPSPEEFIELFNKQRAIEGELKGIKSELSKLTSEDIKRRKELMLQLKKYDEDITKIKVNFNEKLEFFKKKIIENVKEELSKWDSDNKEKMATLSRDVEVSFDVFNDRINALESVLKSELKDVNNRLDKLASDLHEMAKIYNGLSDKRLSYFGLSLGGFKVGGEVYPKIAIDYEIIHPDLMSLNGVSTFVEIAYLDWVEDTEFKTLPGLGLEDFEEDNSVTTLSLGVKFTPYIFNEKMHLYTGGMFGHSISGENTFDAGLILGIEMYPKKIKMALEIRFNYYSSIERQEVEFDAFGDANITYYEKSESTCYLGFKVML